MGDYERRRTQVHFSTPQASFVVVLACMSPTWFQRKNDHTQAARQADPAKIA